jgi:hypothetical protein
LFYRYLFNLKYKGKYKIYLKNADHAFTGTVPQTEEMASTGWTYTNQGGNEREGACTRSGNGTNTSTGGNSSGGSGSGRTAAAGRQ